MSTTVCRQTIKIKVIIYESTGRYYTCETILITAQKFLQWTIGVFRSSAVARIVNGVESSSDGVMNTFWAIISSLCHQSASIRYDDSASGWWSSGGPRSSRRLPIVCRYTPSGIVNGRLLVLVLLGDGSDGTTGAFLGAAALCNGPRWANNGWDVGKHLDWMNKRTGARFST